MNENSATETISDDLKAALAASPDLDVFAAVAKGQITPRQAEQIIRRRAKDRKRGAPVRHFKSLFSEHHGARHERRAAASVNRKRKAANTKAAKAYAARARERLVIVDADAYEANVEFFKDHPSGAIPVAEGQDLALAATWLTQEWLARRPQPLPVKVAGIVYKAAWPADRKTRTAMKKAQRKAYAAGAIGGRAQPMPIVPAATVAP